MRRWTLFKKTALLKVESPLRLRPELIQTKLAQVAITVIGVLALSSCATAPHKFATYQSGQWESRTAVRDLEKKKTIVTDLEIAARAAGDLRIDVVSSLGLHLATLVITEKEAAGLLTRERRYFRTDNPSLAFEKVLGLTVDPQVFFLALFENPPTKSDWQCAQDKQNRLSKCENRKTKHSIDWFDRENARKKVRINVMRYEITLDLRSFKPNVQLDDPLFRLGKPQGFQELL